MKEEEHLKIKSKYLKRKRIRIWIMFIALFLLIGVTVLAFPSWELFGMPKIVWAPFFYLILFALLIGIGVFWRCPACNGLLGDVFSSKYCPKCGYKFDER